MAGSPHRQARRAGRRRAGPAPPGPPRSHPVQPPRRLRVRHPRAHARDRAAATARGL